jgi:hypothetical protein
MSNFIRNPILDSLGESFIVQCMNRIKHYSYDRIEYVKAAMDIENAILEKEQWDESTGNEYTNTIHDLWFIEDSFWESYDDLSPEDQQYVLNYIKDIFPDAWRP